MMAPTWDSPSFVAFDKQSPEQRLHRYLRRAAAARGLADTARPGVGEQYLAAAQSWEALARTAGIDGTVHSTAQGTICVVDDDEAVRKSLSRFLRLSGFTVREYGSGNALLADSKPPEGCLLLDYELPELNGIETMKQARSQGWVLPAVLMSGSVDADLEQQALQGGAWAFLRKPVDCSVLLATIEETILVQNEAA
jgi:CheY-like chemotaxis protein